MISLTKLTLILGLAGSSLLIAFTAQADNWRSAVRSGDRHYQKAKYDEALIKYLEALSAKGDSALIKFDLGNAYQGLEKFPEAGQAFQNLLGVKDSLARADALYNLGNSLVGAEKFPEAVEAYKSALRLNPKQKDYLHNLELAQRLMQKPPQQEQDQQQQDQQNQNKDKQEQQQDQQNQDQQQKQDQQQEQQQDQNQEQQQQQMAGSMTKEEAERLLNAIQTDERQVQENLRQQAAVEAGVVKDW